MNCKPDDTTQWKKEAGYTNPQDYDNPNVQIVSCDTSGGKYALDVAKVPGTQIATATAELSTTSNQWEVLVTLKSAGATAFANLTAEQATKYYPSASTNEDDFWLDTIAVVLDGNVITAPETNGAIPGGTFQITGNFTQAQATQLANVLTYGSLPLNFKILTADTVSASLGRAQLDGGLIAAAIGLGLVVIYSFLYYRGLGLVSVFSLVIAGRLAAAGGDAAHQVPELRSRAGRDRGPDRGHRHYRRLVRRVLRAIAGRSPRRQGAAPSGGGGLETGPAHDPGVGHRVVHRRGAAVLLLYRGGQGLRVHPRPDHASSTSSSSSCSPSRW